MVLTKWKEYGGRTGKKRGGGGEGEEVQNMYIVWVSLLCILLLPLFSVYPFSFFIYI